jgi:hypothetical protein
MDFGLKISSGSIDIELQGSWQEELPDYPGRFWFRAHPDATTYMCGCPMHICALEVHRPDTDGIQMPVNMDLEKELDSLWAVHEPDGGLCTSTITDSQGKEREVVIYITPHGD